MEQRLYSVYDKVAKLYGPIFQAVNDGIATRNVIHMMENVKAYDRPSFVLYKIAHFDDELGVVEGFEPVFIDIEFPNYEIVPERKFAFEKEGD